MSEIIKVSTADGEVFDVLRSVIESKSKTARDVINGVDGDITTQVIPLLGGVTGPSFRRTIEWLDQHKDDKEPEPEPKAEGDQVQSIATSEQTPPPICDWDKEFFAKLSQSDLFQLILTANYLDIRPLLNVVCRTVANMVLGKTPDQIYEMFGVKDKLTPEEEEEVRKENPWLEDN